MELTYNYSDTRPQIFTFERVLGRKKYSINFDVVELPEAEDNQRFRYQSVTLPAGEYNRATVISSIIRSRYSDDEMQAVINNYLLDEHDEGLVAEFNAMQDCRKFAKSVATEFAEAIGEQE